MTSPAVLDYKVRKSVDTRDRIIVKGSNRNVRELIEMGTSFIDLREASRADEPVVTGSETLYEEAVINEEEDEIETPSHVFDRNVDYEMDYREGQIRATADGAVDAGARYPIEYDIETTGAYPSADDVDASTAKEVVQQLPGLTSPRVCEQVAFAVYERFKEPRYEVDVTIPRQKLADFDPLETLTFEGVHIPDEAMPLEVRGDPEVTPSGITLKLGSRGRLEEALNSLSERVRQVSHRV